MQFGPSLAKSHMLNLVRDTKWNGFLELNRMAFTDVLPRNSESRALGIALRMIRKHYPHIEWIVSFADACQCGDGTIYRAAGFILTLIKTNKDVMRFADGSVGHKMSQVTGGNRLQHFAATGGKWSGIGTPLEGHTLRYVYFLNPAARGRLNAEELPYSAIEQRGASMYRGVRGKQAMAGTNRHSDGAAPIPTLQRQERGNNDDHRMEANDPVMHAQIVKSKLGDAIANPLVSIMRKHAGDVIRYASEFGLTPAARSRITSGIHGDDSQSKFAGLIAG